MRVSGQQVKGQGVRVGWEAGGAGRRMPFVYVRAIIHRARPIKHDHALQDLGEHAPSSVCDERGGAQ